MGNRLYFVNNDGIHGDEVWGYSQDASLAAVYDTYATTVGVLGNDTLPPDSTAQAVLVGGQRNGNSFLSPSPKHGCFLLAFAVPTHAFFVYTVLLIPKEPLDPGRDHPCVRLLSSIRKAASVRRRPP